VKVIFARHPLADPEPLIRRVHAYVVYRLGDGPDAEDVTSEVFARALRHRETYDRSKGDPLAWLIGIARRVVAEEFARRVAAPTAVLPETGDGRDLEDDTLRRLALADAVRGLGERDAELIALRYGADLSAREIARLLNARKNTIEVALHRARSRLAELLRADEDAHIDLEVETEAVSF
jgi:RNA polymerase sigma factor (sigma-70 family)